MLQAIIRKGKIVSEEIPAPSVIEGNILIKVINSCVSVGTETSVLASSKKSSIRKALESSEKIKKFFLALKQNGFSSVYSKVKNLQKKDEHINELGSPSGYSLSGVVVAVGEGVSEFKAGDMVAAAGAGKASHAEYVMVPKNLVVRKPKEVSFEDASIVAIGSIALQGVRRANLQIGETCVVFGTGLIGLIAIQILNNMGIRVIALDIDTVRLDTAMQLGAERSFNASDAGAVDSVLAYTAGIGADACIFTAATSDSEPLSSALNMLRRKGKLVLVGVSGDKLKRKDIYMKEIDFLISTSYGPGRYDSNYEEKGHDYPFSYVRWTEKRNMEEIQRMLSKGIIRLNVFSRKSFPIARVDEAFTFLKQENDKLKLVFLDYGDEGFVETQNIHKITRPVSKKISTGKPILGIAGIGNFTINMHLPNLENLKEYYTLRGIMNKTGIKAKFAYEKYDAQFMTTEFDDLLNDEEINLVMICTNHASHAPLTLKALEAGKNVFLEKPLAINQEQLTQIQDFYNQRKDQETPLLMVGFNRRFSKYIREIKKHTDSRINPLYVHYRMNAGNPPKEHWLYTEGGRIIGEACHIIDLFDHLVNSKVVSIYAETINPANELYTRDENKVITLKYEDGSLCILEYLSLGNKNLAKEYMEVHFDGKSIILDDYKKLYGYGVDVGDIKSQQSEKGHREELIELSKALQSTDREWPISLESMIETTNLSLLAADQ